MLPGLPIAFISPSTSTVITAKRSPIPSFLPHFQMLGKETALCIYAYGSYECWTCCKAMFTFPVRLQSACLWSPPSPMWMYKSIFFYYCLRQWCELKKKPTTKPLQMRKKSKLTFPKKIKQEREMLLLIWQIFFDLGWEFFVSFPSLANEIPKDKMGCCCHRNLALAETKTADLFMRLVSQTWCNNRELIFRSHRDLAAFDFLQNLWAERNTKLCTAGLNSSVLSGHCIKGSCAFCTGKT